MVSGDRCVDHRSIVQDNNASVMARWVVLNTVVNAILIFNDRKSRTNFQKCHNQHYELPETASSRPRWPSSELILQISREVVRSRRTAEKDRPYFSGNTPLQPLIACRSGWHPWMSLHQKHRQRAETLAMTCQLMAASH
jgi:hypothetical protein